MVLHIEPYTTMPCLRVTAGTVSVGRCGQNAVLARERPEPVVATWTAVAGADEGESAHDQEAVPQPMAVRTPHERHESFLRRHKNQDTATTTDCGDRGHASVVSASPTPKSRPGFPYRSLPAFQPDRTRTQEVESSRPPPQDAEYRSSPGARHRWPVRRRALSGWRR